MRAVDWEMSLGEYLQRDPQPFSYGAWDCCQFVAGAIRVMTGIDPAVHGYHGAQGARKVVAKYGSLQGAVSAVLGKYGFAPIRTMYARRGDIVMTDRSVGVVGLDGWHGVFLTRHGYARIPLQRCIAAWRIE